MDALKEAFKNLVGKGIEYFLQNFFEELISAFGSILSDIYANSLDVLSIPLVQSGILYAQGLAFAILVLKSMSEAFQTYVLYNNGDPDADPMGLVIRTGQATAIITVLPWLVKELFTFGTKVSADISGLATGKAGISDWTYIRTALIGTGGSALGLLIIGIIILLIAVSIQATIRGAELALMSVLGPIMALNITANNRTVWSQWFKQTLIICVSQSLQIFMIQGALSLLTSQSISNGGLLLVLGWLWVTIKSPKYIQQFAYSTGFTGAVGGTAKQAGSMYIMRKMMTK